MIQRALPLAALAALAPLAARGDAWSVEPRLRLATEYASNARLTVDDPVRDVSGQLEAVVRITRDSGVRRLWLEPRVLAVRYRNESMLDATDRALSAGFERRGEQGGLTLTADYLRDSTLTSELGTSGLSDVEYPHRRLLFAAQAQRALSERWTASAQAAWSDDRYSAPATSGLSDYRYASAMFAGSYAANERLRLSLQAATSRLEVPGRADTWNHSVALSAAYALSESMQLDAAAGPTRVVRSGRSAAGQTLRLGLMHRSERVRSTLSFARETLPTGRGLLDRRDRWSAEFFAPLGETTTAILALQRTRSRDVVPGLGFVADQLRYTAASGVLRRQLTPTLAATVSVGWQSQRLDRNFEAARGWRGGLALHWSGRPPAP